ncbi:MAG: hypothetical protein LBW85_11270 [Deltaproteobacteria bacterium]|jgi:hypothetical protein|nr:hypothetical protein [Deltaproteobacteria bacterium]
MIFKKNYDDNSLFGIFRRKKRKKSKALVLINSITDFIIVLAIALTLMMSGCGGMASLMGEDDDKPDKIDVPSDPINAAAVNGLMTSYKESTMWQIQNVKTLGMTPMAPTGELLELQDPKEVYCVCLEYEARYKVQWSTSQGSPWERTVRNILVIKTQGDAYTAVRPMNVCSPFCG